MLASPLVALCLVVLVSASPVERRQGGPSARVVTSCTQPNTVALTFDDGPYTYLKDVSDTLTNNNVIGTFFFNGNNYDCIYDNDSAQRVQYAVAHGHQVASHTWSHTDLTTLNWDQIHNEMWLVEQALWKIVGRYPAFMRPRTLNSSFLLETSNIRKAYGNYNNLVLQASYIRGQVVAVWDFDSGDSTGSTPAQSEAAYDALIAKHPSNILALNHETQETTAHQVLPYAIKKLKAAGYRLVSLAECTGLPAYQKTQAPTPRDSTWHC
ncbi:carbohydrate esterase family 4 protein [Laccaria amethystina LaAM-08-1]|uniref:Carbohydrate esterase family 4 protein n=1 Tax=Laccaria amethystina LaAM-08-1 TaxID=1095629 RepID=A0A0C9X9D5_9AGAR|nr:carbohydrate esterase family 4 protein [Laccaria amethystina LaAM-08-1]